MINKARKLFMTRKKRSRFALRQKAKNKLRLSVFRSNQHIYAQIIDDNKSITLASASTIDKMLKDSLQEASGACNIRAARLVGELIAKRAKELNLSDVVFDRGGYSYHGKVKALAEAARGAGLNF